MANPSVKEIFPTLRILPVEKMLTHEHCEPLRLLALKERLVLDHVLRNPPVVTPLQDPQDRFVVLDGANRIRAFQMLDIPHILVQVVRMDEPGLKLLSWNRVVLGITPGNLLDCLGDIPGLTIKLEERNGLPSETLPGQIVLQVLSPGGDIHTAFTPSSDLQDRLDLLNYVMDMIGKCARSDRTQLDSLVSLDNLYSDLAGLLIFPPFQIEEVMQLASAGKMIPAGITRFIISPRALRVNYRISELGSGKSLNDKELGLRSWICERITRNGTRSYSESTVLFDE